MPQTGSSVFSVATRTIALKTGAAPMGVGGGIVADSDPAEEYRECLLKAGFLTRHPRNFQLIETMLWENADLPFLRMHLDRLKASANYFSFPFDRSAILARIADTTQQLQPDDSYRIRLLLASSGDVSLTATKFTADTATITIGISDKATTSTAVCLLHNTTHPEQYH